MHRLLIALTLFLLAACQKGDTGNITAEDTIRAASSIIAAVKEFAPSSDKVQALTKEEFNSLHSFEYKVLEFSDKIPQPEIAKELSQLGNDSWDCFSIMNRGDKILITCKRRPKSALNLLRHLSPLVQ